MALNGGRYSSNIFRNDLLCGNARAAFNEADDITNACRKSLVAMRPWRNTFKCHFCQNRLNNRGEYYTHTRSSPYRRKYRAARRHHLVKCLAAILCRRGKTQIKR